MDRHEIASALREIATILELQRAPGYKVQAYVKGARAIEAVQHPDGIGGLVTRGALTTLPGIGDSLSALVTELHTTGRSMLLDRMRGELPRGALELSRVATLEQIKRLAESGVTTLAELEAACVEGRVRDVKGFGEKTEAKLLERVRALRAARPAMKLAQARELAAELGDVLRGTLGPELDDVEMVGAARRGEEVVGELELLVVAPVVEPVARAVASLSRVAGIERTEPVAQDIATFVGALDDATKLVVHVAPSEVAGFARFVTTGPADHVALVIRTLTTRRFTTEPTVYAAARRTYIPPELRDDVDAGAVTRPDVRLVEASDIQGVIHCHTTFSDGRHSVAEMVRAAEALGMRYITITDHSPTASYANGVTLDRLERQWEEIAKVQETTRVRILRGTESDILADGALDYPDHVLERFDVVIASIHNRHGQDEDAMTKRLVRALRLPIQKIWGHPLGRLLLRRPPVAARMDEVLAAILESGTIIELNGDPNRMDLAPEWARLAKRRGARFVCSVDAHSAHELKYIQNAVTLARRTGLGPTEVLNTLDADAFIAAVRPTSSPKPAT